LTSRTKSINSLVANTATRSKSYWWRDTAVKAKLS